MIGEPIKIRVEYDQQTDNLLFIAEEVDMAFALTRYGDWSKMPETFQRLATMAGYAPPPHP